MRDEEKSREELIAEISRLREQLKERKISPDNREAPILPEQFVLNFNLSPAMMSIKGISDGKFIEVNRSFEMITGYQREECIGRSAYDLNLWLQPCADSQMDVMFDGDGCYHQMEVQFVTKFGKHRVGMVSEDMIEFNQQQCLLSVIQDITDYRKAIRDYERIFNFSYDMICITDLQGNFKLVNPAFINNLGYSEKEILKMRTVDLLHPDDMVKTLTEKKQAMASNNPTIRLRNRYRHLDGSYRWLEWTAVPVQNERLMYSVARDVTDYLQAEETIIASELRFRTAFDNIPDCLSIHRALRNPQGEIVDFIYDYVNETESDFLGLPVSTLLGKGLLELFPGHYSDGLFRDFCSIVESGFPLSREAVCYGGEHHQLCIDIKGAKFRDGLIVSWRDVSERWKRESELRASEERFQKIFQNSPDMIAIIRIADDKFIEINPKFTAAMGFSRQQILEHSPDELNLWPENSTNLGMLHCQQRVTNLELDFQTRHGQIITALVSTEIISINEQLCRLILMKDITEKKKMENDLMRLDRLHLVGEMAASISHEVRNPLCVVRGFLELLEEKRECAKYRDQFELMINELDRANSIITEFLSLAKNKHVEFKKYDINQIIRSIFPLLEADAAIWDKEIILHLENVPEILLDEKEFRQLLLNLVRNGMESMPSGGEMTICTQTENDEIVLMIRDQGCGIPAEVQANIGQPFITTKDNGTGLGLSVCYSICHRHRAKIDFDTSPQGTTFYIRFREEEMDEEAV